jgi:hypothetical protein
MNLQQPTPKRSTIARLAVGAAHVGLTIEELADRLAGMAGILPAGKVPPPVRKGRA